MQTIIKRILAKGGESAKRIPFATVAGVLTTRPGLIGWIDRHVPAVEIITTKSYQVLPNPGNREPILVEPEPGSFGNAVGLRNPGMEQGFAELKRLLRRQPLRAALNVSLSANSIEDFQKLVECFADLADILELNFSCPHARAGYGAAIGSQAETVAEYIKEIRPVTRTALFVKLTPNVDRIGEIALAAIYAGADGLTAINTVGPVKYLEPQTGHPVLNNPPEHRGGKSGEWIRKIAREKIGEIRQAVGAEVPIIGMGGVSTADDVLWLRDAGANVVGLGSVLGRIPRQDMIPLYVAALEKDCRQGSTLAESFLSNKRLMSYRVHTVTESERISDTLGLITLDGRIDYAPGQYVFLFIPGIGEKPFSIADGQPPRFVIRKRGVFSQAALALKPGDSILLRGLYGSEAPRRGRLRAVIVAGGTGIAVVPRLVERLRQQGNRTTLFWGVRSFRETELKKLLQDPSIIVVDGNRKARVLEVMAEHLQGRDLQEYCFYTIGPAEFMERAMEIQEGLGADPNDIFACLETQTLCGVGLCGSCECGGTLMCKEGPFVSRSHLKMNKLKLSEIGDLIAERSSTRPPRRDNPVQQGEFKFPSV